MKTTKLFSPQENRTPAGSGRASGQFAPGKVTPGKPTSGRPISSGTRGSAGGVRSTAPNAQIPSSSPMQRAEQNHARAMAEMDLQQAHAIEQNIKNLKATLRSLRQEIKFWSQPFQPSTRGTGSSTSSGGGGASSQLAGSTATAGAGSKTSSGGAPTSPSTGSSSSSSQSFSAFLQGLKNQAKGIEEHIKDLRAQVRALRQRANEWFRIANGGRPGIPVAASANPDITKTGSGEIIMTAGQLRALLDNLTSTSF